MRPDIFSYITEQENLYQTEEVRVGDNWLWSMRNHVQMIFHLKNGVFFTGANNWLRAFKNIMEPLLQLSYWSEDLEVSDVVFFIENTKGRIMSFLVKKYHDEVFTKEHNLDTLFDDITESDLDYGGVLVQKTNTPRPEVLPLNAIAFCDQTDILGGPIAFKHFFSPSKLRKMSKAGWGDEKNGADISIEELCVLAEPQKDAPGTGSTKRNEVTGKVIPIYVVRGALPEHYLKDNGEMDYHCDQVHVVAFFTNAKGKKVGCTLYKKKDDGESLKFYTSKAIYGRALGRGEGEALLPNQIWTNFLEIHKMNMLESASKVPLYTDDPAYTNRNRIQDMENLEITTVEEGKRIYQVPTAAPANIQLMEQAINQWFGHAQLQGAAFDPILGKQATSGTTFRGQERTVAQGKGLHERRKGQRAKFIEEIYRDWVIPYIQKEVVKGKKFLATLSTEEFAWVSDRLAENFAANAQLEALLSGRLPEEKETLKQQFLKEFAKKGNKHLIEILKDEFKNEELKIGINIANKQKDLVALSDKLLSIFQFVFANPQGFQQAMQIPALAKSFESILEFSGVNVAEFASLLVAPPVQQQATQTPVPQTASPMGSPALAPSPMMAETA